MSKHKLNYFNTKETIEKYLDTLDIKKNQSVQKVTSCCIFAPFSLHCAVNNMASYLGTCDPVETEQFCIASMLYKREQNYFSYEH